jgi:hypothetical protein
MSPLVTIILASIDIGHSNLTSPSIARTPFLISASTSLCVL